MKPYKAKLICGLIIFSIVFFIWNDSLYDKMPEYPIEKERIEMIVMTHVSGAKKVLDETEQDALLDAINSLALVPDQEWREMIETREDGIVPGVDLYYLRMEFKTDFFHRVDYTTWAFYDGGRVMMNAVRAMRPYPYRYDSTNFDHLKIDKVTSDTYDELLNLLAELTGYTTGGIADEK